MVDAEVPSRPSAEEEIARYRRCFVDGPVVVFRWVAAAGWPVEYVSPNVHQLFGVSAEDFISGRVPYASSVHPDDIARVAEEVRLHGASDATGFDQEYRIVRPDGGVRWLYDHTKITRDASGRITHFEGYVLDNTARKDAQLAEEAIRHKLLQTQKLESLGVLAGGIAHDFNNLLTGILANASLALQEESLSPRMRELLQSVVASSERAAELTRQILAYAGQGTTARRVLRIDEQVREIVALVTSTIPKRVRVELDLAEDLPPVEADRAQLQQVVMNLVLNGVEACGLESGLVTVRVRALPQHAPAVRAFAPPASRQWVQIEVQDTGCGMTPDTLERIFDPFFTTKFQGRGLGLSAVIGILRAHSGEIRVESHVGRGSTFSVYLPASTRAASAATSPAASPAPARRAGAGLVLVVDDEALVRTVAAAILRSSGYDVMVARDGVEAIEVLRQHAHDTVAVVLDVTMPKLGGEGALDAVRALNPKVPVLLMSGYLEPGGSTPVRDRERTAFLEKPFTAQSLIAALERLLAGS